MRSALHFLFLLGTLNIGGFVQAEPLFSSGNQQVTLLELYSSEGCSSCPPADRWIASLKDHKKLWKNFVPLNFHVDYWNRLGWVDRFSNQSFSQRQRRYAKEWNSNRVYTPGFVKNGEEWRARSTHFSLGPKVGPLTVSKTKKGQLEVSFQPAQKNTHKLKVHVALLGHRLSTKVQEGENEGETLHHEFVVLGQTESVLKKQESTYKATLTPPKNNKAGASQFSLAVWVTQQGSQKPLQATGGYL